jgi:S-(hydroxymethyl)glutathione dehydrogenase/alcohol dehydrogenase
MQTRAAVLFESPGHWQVTRVELDEPQPGEVLVQLAAAGLCHSDDHASTGDRRPAILPVCGGHEGSGIVRAVGQGVADVAEGDHVATSFVPACGVCEPCAAGAQHLCDEGKHMPNGFMRDGTYRMHLPDGRDVAQTAAAGTFSEWQVMGQRSVVKVPEDLPLDVVALVSCGVPTGWGSATTAAGISVGDVVIVMGCGGIGINAVQGAAHIGAAHVVAVDPAPLKREVSLKLGATEAFGDIAEATEFVRGVTNGQGAHAAIVTTGVCTGEHIGQAFAAIRKAGTVVVTGLGSNLETTIPLSIGELTLYQKRIQGCLYGNGSPRLQIPRLLSLYRNGILKLDELITRRYTLEQLNDGYADMRAGRNIRGIIDFSIL